MMTASSLRIGLLGPVRVTRDGGDVALPKSQKTRALLAYLVLARGPQRRERLSTLFWDVADDPRAGLRWSLSKLRALDEPSARRIVADREDVAFEPNGAQVDALEVLDATADGIDALSTERLRALIDVFRGGFLDGLELPDFEAFQAWRVAQREHFRGIHLALLRATCERLADAPGEALPYARDLVRLAPDDVSARASLIRCLVAAGLREEAGEHYAMARKHVKPASDDDDALRAALQATSGSAAHAATESGDALRQEVRMCTAPDGVHIAYATVGEGPPLLKTANWMSHLEYDWKSPLWRHLARELVRDFRLVRYDQRGTGLSDREAEDFTLDACLGDVEAVADAAGLERFALLGISQGTRTAVAYAAKHPERVSHLVLYGGSARGWKHRSKKARETRGGLQSLIRHGWGGDNPTFRQVFTTLFMPDATPEQMGWFNDLQRVSASADTALRITEATSEWDVSPLLATLRVPTLVLNATGDAMVPFEEGPRFASGIPDARFVALESRNHLLLDDEPAFARFLTEVRDLLGAR
jgi:DNA-binding SARP family transcriptional activator/pimeloyl-ACP methyl ester carboxylesterase